MPEIQSLFDAGDYDALIAAVRTGVADDPRTLTDPTVKKWLGLRWRDLFLKAAMTDEAALAELRKLPGPLRHLPVKGKADPDLRKAMANRFLKDLTTLDWTVDLPEAQYDEIRNSALLLVPGMLTGLLHPGAHAFPTEADEL